MKYFTPLLIPIFLSCKAGDNKKQETHSTPVQDSAQVLVAANDGKDKTDRKDKKMIEMNKLEYLPIEVVLITPK